MRVAIVGPVYPYRGGIAHFNSHLTHYLLKAGHEVKVFSFKQQYPGWLYPGESDQDASAAPLNTRATFLLNPFLPWTWTKCADEISSWQPDLVLIAWWTTFWWLAFSVMVSILNFRKVKTAFLIHNILPHEVHWWDRMVTRSTLRRAKRFLVQSNSQRDRLLDLKPDAIFRQCPHPIYNLLVQPQINQAEARLELGLSSNGFTLLFFGIVRPYKGLRNLLEAVHILKQNGHPTNLLIAGEFWEPLTDYRSLIDNLDLSADVKIFPRYIPNEQLAVYFSAADLLVAPYAKGTQSGVAKLALGYGLPVLVTENIADELLCKFAGRGVTIAQTNNPQDLAAAITLAQKGDPIDQDIMKISGQSWDSFIETIQDLAETT